MKSIKFYFNAEEVFICLQSDEGISRPKQNYLALEMERISWYKLQSDIFPKKCQ